MKFKVVAMSVVVCLSSVCSAQEKQTSQGKAGSIAKSKPKDLAVIPLNNLVEVVEIVVDAYNQRPEVAGWG